MPSPAIVVRHCRRRSTLPSSKDAAGVVVRCRRRRTLLPYAVVSRRRRLLAAVNAGVSGRLNIAKPIQRLRPPVLRHQAEAQKLSAPGAHEAHMGRTWAYARRTPGAKKNNLKSLYYTDLRRRMGADLRLPK